MGPRDPEGDANEPRWTLVVRQNYFFWTWKIGVSTVFNRVAVRRPRCARYLGLIQVQ